MARVTVDVDIDNAALERESGKLLRRKHRSLTRRIANQARADVPVDTGALGRSITEEQQTYTPFRVDGGVTAGGGAENVGYAVFVHEGTRAHTIRARNVQYLRFQWHGREVFRRSVFHPGTRARPFLRNAGTRTAANDPDIA